MLARLHIISILGSHSYNVLAAHNLISNLCKQYKDNGLKSETMLVSSWQYQKEESVFRSPHKPRNTTSLRVCQKTTKGQIEPRFQQHLIWGELAEPLKIPRAQCLEPNELRISTLFYSYLTLDHIDCEIVFLSPGGFPPPLLYYMGTFFFRILREPFQIINIHIFIILHACVCLWAGMNMSECQCLHRSFIGTGPP